MSKPHLPESVFFFCGLLYREDLVSLVEIQEYLSPLFPLEESRELSIEGAGLVNYYEKEMGPKEKLKRLWFCSLRTLNRESLVTFKEEANNLEDLFCEKYGDQDGGRVVNIDPGYVGLEQVVLATNKPYSHRIHLFSGIYADLVYQFTQKEWHPMPWTYPDYQHLEVLSFFKEIRELLHGQIRLEKPTK